MRVQYFSIATNDPTKTLEQDISNQQPMYKATAMVKLDCNRETLDKNIWGAVTKLSNTGKQNRFYWQVIVELTFTDIYI